MRWPIVDKKDGRWRRWWAWHPADVGSLHVWGEWVERRWVPYGESVYEAGGYWIYRDQTVSKTDTSGPKL